MSCDTIAFKRRIVSEIFGNGVAVNNDEELDLLSSKVILTPKNISKVILSPKNTDSLKINHEVLSLLPGDEIVCRSIDSVCTDDEETVINYPSKFLNSLNPSGLPPHELKLKPRCIMLWRNLNARTGLLNGTRLLVISLNAHFLHGKILSGSKKGEEVFIPRINMVPSDTNLPFKLYRLQFPVIPAFAMTNNKSQGQFFNKVGIYLPSPLFAHGQLYVALSRIRNRNNVKIATKSTECQGMLKDDLYFT